MGRWMERWVDWWMVGRWRVHGGIEWVGRTRMHIQMDGWVGQRMNRWKNGWMHRWLDGWIDNG